VTIGDDDGEALTTGPHVPSRISPNS
jgi:hypothetical protein